ncbi:MarR family transcriptional regulator [Maritimibacter alkaliphilus HTCC2654]|jgi:DNA-binding MarR family transcriptional regulator|uniref:Bacterial regulatory protein, MarR n=1 Tax=Maritimibacter alkaliphilus HTCC2654 TaxID=314271 RepID=A3VIJ5_9RHOB|nr:MarR family transcriptional regulator [Maritimibacter alkaliphilus]EAQ11926.1 bacterial regulatory protein, MarR [Rhodobacterales bacterium HTCC2654] [Maritimibacter alkaliphilus HTCC2654]MCR9077362.1 MarR family transcriptional regulator [bacterium]TYP85653.1 MarR family transcriptional regulator [Maritimibacter alkaliphilus HTCC2654]
MPETLMRDVAELTVPGMLQNSVSYQIRLLQIASYKSFEQQMSSHGSAPRYFGLLKIVEANPGIPQTRLAEAIYLDRSSLVPILETLTREGWVERKKSTTDKRVRRVFLTKAGAENLARLEDEVTAHETMVTADLTPAEKATLLDLLARVDKTLRANFGGAS